MRRDRVTIADYGMGNLGSVVKALQYLGLDPRVTGDARELARAEAVVVPGVGAFPDAMERLTFTGMAPAIRGVAGTGRPLLGICLGMQVLYEYGEEGRGAAGLGLLPGRVRRFPAGSLKVPHMGWNTVTWDAPMRLLAGLPSSTHFYFVHSYYAGVPEKPAVSRGAAVPEEAGCEGAPAAVGAGATGTLDGGCISGAPAAAGDGAPQLRVARCGYVVPFAAAVEHDSIMGTQFHPEKSGQAGLRVLANFARLISEEREGEGKEK